MWFLPTEREKEQKQPKLNQPSNNSGNNRTVNNTVAEGKDIQHVTNNNTAWNFMPQTRRRMHQTRLNTYPEVEGMNVQALLDTGSSVKIVSAKFFSSIG